MSLTWPDPLPASGPVGLRPFVDADLGLVAELASDPYIPMIGTVPAVFTEAEGRAYLARQHQRLRSGAGYSFAIADLETGRAVGGASLWLHQGGRATAGYVVAPAARGRGFGTAALRAVTAFAWTLNHLDRVELFIEPWNIASLKVAESAGYQRDQLVPSHAKINGRWRDMQRFLARR